MSVDQVYLKPGNQGVIQRGGNLLFLFVSVLLSVVLDQYVAFGADDNPPAAIKLAAKEVVLGKCPLTADLSLDKIAASRDGQHLAFQVRHGAKSAVWADGIETALYDRVEKPVFSPDGKRLAFFAQTNGNWFVVVDGRTFAAGEQPTAVLPVFSADGSRLAFGVKRGSKYAIVLDGAEGQLYDGLSFPYIFSADGKHFAHAARKDRKWLMVVDGNEGEPYDEVAANGESFSPDSRRFAYPAKRGNKCVMVLEGKEATRFTILSTASTIASARTAVTLCIAPGEMERAVWL